MELVLEHHDRKKNITFCGGGGIYFTYRTIRRDIEGVELDALLIGASLRLFVKKKKIRVVTLLEIVECSV
jgi:hypothetical protein